MFFFSSPHLFLTLPSMLALMLRQSDKTGIPHLLCFDLLCLTDVFSYKPKARLLPAAPPPPAKRLPLALLGGLEPNLQYSEVCL